MRKIFQTSAFTLVELIIVVVIIIIGTAISFYAFQNRISHFRLRSASRELLEMSKLAQASAIRANSQFNINFIDNQTYRFLSGNTSVFSGNEGRIGRTITLPPGISFAPVAANGPCGASIPCFTPVFNSDGTISLGSGSKSMRVTDGNENFDVIWTVGGSIRIP